jgi:hypothetical protein
MVKLGGDRMQLLGGNTYASDEESYTWEEEKMEDEDAD